MLVVIFTFIVLGGIFGYLYRKGVLKQCEEMCAHQAGNNNNEDEYVTDEEISSGYDSDVSRTESSLPSSEE